jgi:SAM-dependent methyltransferase
VLESVKRVLKPDGLFVFDVIDPDLELAENWAILETYLGAEVFLEPLANWKRLIQSTGAQIVKPTKQQAERQTGQLFQLYKVRFD